MSTMPVREALLRLVSHGMVLADSNRSFTVATTTTPSGIRDILDPLRTRRRRGHPEGRQRVLLESAELYIAALWPDEPPAQPAKSPAKAAKTPAKKGVVRKRG